MGVLAAVNHSGDSDSTGAITGNLLGAALGATALPEHWLEVLELRADIETLADDAVSILRDPWATADDEELNGRYPLW